MKLENTIESIKEYCCSKNGYCLETEYKGVEYNYKCICEKGHHFNLNWHSVKKYNCWCHYCSGWKIDPNNIDKIKKYCIERGGQCLEDVYKGGSYKYKCLCKNNHEFYLNWNSAVNMKTWCPYCAKVKVDPIEEIKKIHKYCSDNKGICLEQKYKGSYKKYKCICEKGHEFDLIWAIAKGKDKNTWCKYCKGKLDPIKEMKKIHDFCKNKKGKCLDNEYKGTHKKYLVVCENGHKFKLFWKDSKIRNTWCPYCYNKRDPVKEIKNIHKYAKSRGGKCLEDKYKGSLKKYKCICEKGHEFEASWAHMKTSKSWCPFCVSYKLTGEKVVRKILENIFKCKFAKTKHKKLINPKTNRLLELDGFNEELKIGFEYQGYQHFRYPNFFHKTKKRHLECLERDRIKRKLCEENGIFLIEIKEIENEKINEKKLEEKIFSLLKNSKYESYLNQKNNK